MTASTKKQARTLEVSCWSKEPRNDDLVGKGELDISETLQTGEFDGECTSATHVAIVVISAAIGGLYFWMRHRKRAAAEEEYKRTQVADYMRGGERKPPNTGYSTTSDSRLDPEFGARRDSVGSIADNQDYSRKILRVSLVLIVTRDWSCRLWLLMLSF